MWLAFGLLNEDTDLVESDWKKMAITVSDPTIISLSDYEKTEYGYSLEVTGKKEGSTNVIVTDTDSGASTTITITVYDNYTKTYSYDINKMPSFYPSNKYENKIQTNIYNLSGLYINDYSSKKIPNEDKYYVSFDVYNTRYYNGAVDIYDADGIWIESAYIDKYSDITSIKEALGQAFYLVKNSAEKEALSYKSSSFSKKTHIEIKVPEGGYFTVSNNFAESPGAFFANTFEILYDTTSDLLDFATSKDIDGTSFDKFYKEATKTFAQNIIDARNETLSGEAKEKMMEVALDSLTSEIKKVTKKFVKADVAEYVTLSSEMFCELSNLTENILNSYDISWKHLYQLATGVAESAFTKFIGPAGVALKACFSITKASNKLLMAVQMANSSDYPYVNVYTEFEEKHINSHGVIVNTAGNIDVESTLQVFRVSNSDLVSVLLDNNNTLKQYELYNICFVKDDKLVQPNGKVKVYIPIPEGMKGNTCKVYRRESDDSWTILDAHIAGNYLTFETNHFSFYAIVGDKHDLRVESVASKLVYSSNDILNTEGLVLSLNGEKITSGYICEPTVLSGTGNVKISVKYGDLSTSFDVKLVNSSSDYIYFGSYPQTKVTDSATISALNSLAPNWNSWISYGYYTGEGLYDWGTMTPGDWMRYTDVRYNGEIYRGVKFTQCRPYATYWKSTNRNTNGYSIGVVYWFKFEPLQWRVLDASEGLVMCETIIDAQPYSNIIYFNGRIYFNDSSHTNYACDYETSSIRAWLNADFYNTAFSSEEQSAIATTMLKNDGYYTLIGEKGYEKFDSHDTNDKIFLLSYDEAINSDYGFSASYSKCDVSRQAKGSDYAKCQSLYMYSDNSYPENSCWLLRSPGNGSDVGCVVRYDGYVSGNYYADVSVVHGGVRPALRLKLSSVIS